MLVEAAGRSAGQPFATRHVHAAVILCSPTICPSATTTYPLPRPPSRPQAWTTRAFTSKVLNSHHFSFMNSPYVRALLFLAGAYYKGIYSKEIGSLLAGSGSKALPGLRNLAMELRKVCNHPVSDARQSIMQRHMLHSYAYTEGTLSVASACAYMARKECSMRYPESSSASTSTSVTCRRQPNMGIRAAAAYEALRNDQRTSFSPVPRSSCATVWRTT